MFANYAQMAKGTNKSKLNVCTYSGIFVHTSTYIYINANYVSEKFASGHVHMYVCVPWQEVVSACRLLAKT